MLAALITLAQAGDIVNIDVVVVGADAPLAIPGDAPPPPPLVVVPRPVVVAEEEEDDATWERPERRAELQLQAATHFLPDAPAHHLAARHVGKGDSYLMGELRYLPDADLLWVGRVGAGLDLLGGDAWDLTLGLFAGSAGTWSHEDARRVLYASPVGGTEVALGVESDRLFARYRWLAGMGGGPLDDLLTENEFTLGYKVTRGLHGYGQWVRVNPGEDEARGGIGLGVRAVF